MTTGWKFYGLLHTASDPNFPDIHLSLQLRPDKNVSSKLAIKGLSHYLGNKDNCKTGARMPYKDFM